MPTIRSQDGFTFLEILIVLVIISGLLIFAISSYTNVREKSFDERRKTDLEEIRSGLEQYRSVNNAYPTPNSTPGLPFGSAMTDGTNTYLQRIPQDPQYPAKQYNYTTAGDDYTLAAQLTNPETPACLVPPGGDLCGRTGSGFACNYCLGSYGKK